MFNKVDALVAKLDKLVGDDGIKTDVKIELGTDTIVQLIFAIASAIIIVWLLHGIAEKLIK